MMKKMIKTVVFLFSVSALSGALLAYCESKTKPLIEANQLKIEHEAQKSIIDSNTFKEVTVELDGEKKAVKVAYNDNNLPLGAIFKVAPKGFGGDITMLVGISTEGRVTGYKILSHSETPGLGSKLLSEKFAKGISRLLKMNPSPNFSVKKDGGDVDAITAATISSRAFCKGINSALDLFGRTKQVLFTPAPESNISGGNQ